MTIDLETLTAPGYLTRCNAKGNAMTNPVQFFNQVRAEVGKITWPARREVVTTTIMVLIMAAICALFFSLVDLGIRTGLAQVLRLVGQ